MFEKSLNRWNLTPDGEPLVTPSSHLLPVRRGGVPAMLKIAGVEEERAGGNLMVWWDGDGAAGVLAHHEGILLLERATGPRSLTEMVQAGQDDEATRVLCAAAARLHAPRSHPLPDLVPLTRWFRDLGPAAKHGGIFRASAVEAERLLADPQEVTVLHGDIHHGNVLDFGTRGWLAIDPKGLYGERGFDFANLFCNPDRETATAPGRLLRQVEVVCECAGLERRRLLQWILAWTGLSAAWMLEDGDTPEVDLTVAEIAVAELR
ncbi:MAG: aminoglycoside phosphotransferase family protein [Fimbriimonas sp.]